jgi:hypothetical protein
LVEGKEVREGGWARLRGIEVERELRAAYLRR